MGYKLGIQCSSSKADADFTALPGVKIDVFKQGVKIGSTTTDAQAADYLELDFSSDGGAPDKLMACYGKAGYKDGAVIIDTSDSYLDGDGVRHYVCRADVLLVPSAELLPPPETQDPLNVCLTCGQPLLPLLPPSPP